MITPLLVSLGAILASWVFLWGLNEKGWWPVPPALFVLVESGGAVHPLWRCWLSRRFS